MYRNPEKYHENGGASSWELRGEGQSWACWVHTTGWTEKAVRMNDGDMRQMLEEKVKKLEKLERRLEEQSEKLKKLERMLYIGNSEKLEKFEVLEEKLEKLTKQLEKQTEIETKLEKVDYQIKAVQAAVSRDDGSTAAATELPGANHTISDSDTSTGSSPPPGLAGVEPTVYERIPEGERPCLNSHVEIAHRPGEPNMDNRITDLSSWMTHLQATLLANHSDLAHLLWHKLHMIWDTIIVCRCKTQANRYFSVWCAVQCNGVRCPCNVYGDYNVYCSEDEVEYSAWLLLYYFQVVKVPPVFGERIPKSLQPPVPEPPRLPVLEPPRPPVPQPPRAPTPPPEN